ncbi:MAG: glucosaminidase domain-containing protein [Clostridiales bacterium]|nr:glucosaminidase domain-containing protein [Clostridiales bacterium]
MREKAHFKILFLFLTIFIVMFLNINHIYASTNSNIHLIVNNNDITSFASPIIENDRTLVPVRFIAEEIGATVYWDGINRTVTIKKDGKSILLFIDSNLISYNNNQSHIISDVAPKIINDRTYVPVRLISNIFGIGVSWNNETRTVYINTEEQSTITSFFDIDFSFYKSGDTISGKTIIDIEMGDKISNKISEIKLVLLDKGSKKGFVVSRVDDKNRILEYIPKVEDNGEKVLVVAVYDEYGKFIGGEAITINIDVKPVVALSNLDTTKLVTDTIYIKPSINFLATQVKYEITNYKSGKTITVTEQDPFGSYAFVPTMELNGVCAIKVIAYDGNGHAYESQIKYITVLVNRYLSIKGISEGKSITKAVVLSVNRNFDVVETQFIVMNTITKEKEILMQSGQYSYEWFPKPSNQGDMEVYTIVTDTNGVNYESEHIKVIIDVDAILYIKGIGPNQIITKDIDLFIKSNVDLYNVRYVLTNVDTKIVRYLSKTLNDDDTFIYFPINIDIGNISIHAEGFYHGYKIKSEAIILKVYLDTIYGPKAIIAKNRFLGFASKLAVNTWNETGMSAALQTAQAILETGWGQSVPVDKYTGKLSYNLFGIKGSGSNGFVISNTWEVYNGVVYRIDDEFRAYYDVSESWDDHQYFLFNSSRYKPFTDVMYDSTLGAWAIKRAGYATDPLYPIKLIRIIKQYNLGELDKIMIK